MTKMMIIGTSTLESATPLVVKKTQLNRGTPQPQTDTNFRATRATGATGAATIPGIATNDPGIAANVISKMCMSS